MIQRIYQAINFRILKLMATKNICPNNNEKVIYLTFDDGPEPDITIMVLDLLDQYQAKATFFNIGKNNELYPNLLEEIIARGHCVGNHTYRHLNGLKTSTKQYLYDIERCTRTFKSDLLRPAYGAISLISFFKLRKKYKIVLWNKGSNDHNNDTTDYQKEVRRMVKDTKSGDIVLFHNKKEYEKQTLSILSSYLKFLSDNHFTMKAIK